MKRIGAQADIEFVTKVVSEVSGELHSMEKVFDKIWTKTEGQQPKLLIQYSNIASLTGYNEDGESINIPCMGESSKFISATLTRNELMEISKDLKIYKWEKFLPALEIVSVLINSSEASIANLKSIVPVSVIYPENEATLVIDKMKIEEEGEFFYFWSSIGGDCQSACLFFDLSVLEDIYPDLNWLDYLEKNDLFEDYYDQGYETDLNNIANKEDNHSINSKRTLFFKGWMSAKDYREGHVFSDITREKLWSELGRNDPQLFPPKSLKTIDSFFESHKLVSFKSGRPKNTLKK